MEGNRNIILLKEEMSKLFFHILLVVLLTDRKEPTDHIIGLPSRLGKSTGLLVGINMSYKGTLHRCVVSCGTVE